MTPIVYNRFPSMNSKIAQATVFSLTNGNYCCSISPFIDLNDAPQSADKQQVFLTERSKNQYVIDISELGDIPGSPIAFWIKKSYRNIFKNSKSIGEVTVAMYWSSKTGHFYLRRFKVNWRHPTVSSM